ncbi:Hypothetical protein NTJ_11029 [Nesidiocoris tenuis]|uniref:Uncharacterized protein n=1 Tax=Nesidiocoris tenuis TaxID=355587 RepID=A0ABN7B1A8_9HEMI|nr:Hypothetical protein NTJ_11029 [Nesidiocoris tenuis]
MRAGCVHLLPRGLERKAAAGASSDAVTSATERTSGPPGSGGFSRCVERLGFAASSQLIYLEFPVARARTTAGQVCHGAARRSGCSQKFRIT